MRWHGVNQNPSLNEANPALQIQRQCLFLCLWPELPSLTDSAMKDSQIDSQSLFCTAHVLSAPVKKIASSNQPKSIDKQGVTYRLSTPVTTSQAREE